MSVAAKSRKVGASTGAAGNRGKGRKPGVPNKATASVKQAITDAFEKRGGVPSLVAWANAEPTEFYKLWGRLAPSEVTNTVKGKLEVTVRVAKEGRRVTAS